MKQFIRFLILLTVAMACQEEEGEGPAPVADYFPLRQGVYQVYTVHEVRYTISAPPEVLDYELMSEVVDSFPSADGYTYVIHRSKRASPTAAWEALDTWSARLSDNDLVVSEGNVPFVRIRLPVFSGNRWDGNAWNTMEQDEYTFVDIGKSVELGGMTFENTATVEQENNQDRIVYYDTRSEVYAAGVGLVVKEVTQLNYCTDDPCLGQEKVENGIELKMEIKEYGTH